MKTSVMLGNLRQPFEQSLETTHRLGISAVQLPTEGQWAPETFDATARHKLLKALEQYELGISALWAGFIDLGNDAEIEAKLPAIQRTLDMAADVGAGIAAYHVGIIPHSTQGARWQSYLRNAETIARYGEKAGACLAIETGPEPPAVLEKLLTTVDSAGLRINYDPANLIIWPALLAKRREWAARAGRTGPYDEDTALREYEPVEGVHRLRNYIVHVHAKDAKVVDGQYAEVPLGEGWVDWPRFLGFLKKDGYDGYIAIEREVKAEAEADIAHAVNFLKGQMQKS